ncbi:MAG: histidinol dehydrogenase [Paracoccaceae bacterium]
MPIVYLKKATSTAETGQADVRAAVEAMLAEIDRDGEKAVQRFARDFDKWEGEIIVTPEQRAKAAASIPEQLKDDIRFAHANIRRFAEAQKATISDCTVEIIPGLTAGQRQIPVKAAGCYVPGGRYSHIASAIMTITTAKVAGVPHIAACSPPRPGIGIPATMIFTMDLCGADVILNLGGVQGISTMAKGLFGIPRADILVGPGNQYVAESKRILYGEVGIDMFAGPTDSMVIADSSADPQFVAWDLVGQAEHGYNSPVWLVTTDRALAEEVLRLVPGLIDQLPSMNAANARLAWADFAEVILCDTPSEMVEVADEYAPEHLHVQAADPDWWLENLSSFGSLFLGEETTVAFGDKTSGPNHVLPTSGAARYTGGLSVHKFMKTVTWQRATRTASKQLAIATARISREEGMEGHARTADMRLAKFFPDETFDLGRKSDAV